MALGTGALSSCTAAGRRAVRVPASVRDRSRTERLVSFASWYEYVDQLPDNPSEHPTLTEFTRQTGIRVDYSVPITSNEQFVGQLGLHLAMGENAGVDLMILTDWMVAELIDLGWAEPLSAAMLPNARRLLPEFRQTPLPDVLGHSLPWQASFTGIAWNATATHGRPVTSMTDLLTSPDLRGRVGLVAEWRDVIGLVLLEMGHDPADVTGDQFDAALKQVDRAIRAGQIRTVTDYYTTDLIAGDIAACVAWPGDITYYQQQMPQLKFVLPRAGGMLYTDNMVIPAFARHKENAERLMDFYYQPEIAAKLTVYEQYLCPVTGTQEVMRVLDPALAEDPYIFPSAGLLARGHAFRLLTSEQNTEYASRYAATVGL
jgi:spermidine/putrescine transport system substrate-binding protein